jgi:phosphoribosyl-AMP cyclohydrolase
MHRFCQASINPTPSQRPSGATGEAALFSVESHPYAKIDDRPPQRRGKMHDEIEGAVAEIRFDRDGLVPAIAQQHDSGETLMVAWMNREAVRTTLTEGRACYWSRARAKLWRKGETSGQVQLLRELRLDCDGDTVLLLVDQQGVACHTGRRSCFFRAWRDGGWVVIAKPQVSPEILYPEGSERK